jgi:hypothetical protein
MTDISVTQQLIDSARQQRISAMFETARSFIAGASIIMSSNGIEDEDGLRKPTLPVTMCCAFAIELGIKTLLEAHGVERPRRMDGHDLKELVGLLPEGVWEDFLSHHDARVDVTREEVEALIEGERHTFKQWRYPYESAHDLETQPSKMLELARGLHFYIQDRYAIERSYNGWLKPDGIG